MADTSSHVMNATNQQTTARKFFIVRLIDCHGDEFPTHTTLGIDGIEHATRDEAIAAAKAYKPNKADRALHGWEKGTIKSVAVSQVEISPA